MLCLTVCVGCSSSKESSSPSPAKKTREYEKEFDPRKYDVKDKPAAPAEGRKTATAEAKEPAPAPPLERMERLSGFRVQIYSTNDLDDAVRTKTASQAVLDSLKVYMVYDAPYYKIRVGDFRERPEADQAKDALRAKGFSDAWVVPDQVSRPVPGDR